MIADEEQEFADTDSVMTGIETPELTESVLDKDNLR